jgi:hypothetical protein
LSDDPQAKRDKDDMIVLLRLPEFRKFLFRVIQKGGLFDAVTDGSGGRSLDYFEGRRNLVLELLDMAESGQPINDAHSSGPLLTLIQVLIEETQKPPEKPNGRRNSHDRNLDDDGDSGDDD